jgi:hypothetical protein
VLIAEGIPDVVSVGLGVFADFGIEGAGGFGCPTVFAGFALLFGLASLVLSRVSSALARKLACICEEFYVVHRLLNTGALCALLNHINELAHFLSCIIHTVSTSCTHALWLLPDGMGLFGDCVLTEVFQAIKCNHPSLVICLVTRSQLICIIPKFVGTHTQHSNTGV